MTDYEYIMAQSRKFHFTQWDENVLRECQSIMPNLTREELVKVYRSRLLDERHPLKKTAFNVLFAIRSENEKSVSKPWIMMP